jgi:iron complex transport system substrate-binding protein
MIKKRLMGLVMLFLLILLASCKPEDNGGDRQIKDMANRTVQIPEKVTKVFSLLPSGTMFVYTIDPELLIGTNYQFNNNERAFILEKYHDLQVYGQSTKINWEAVIAAKPDIIIAYSDINVAQKANAEEVEETTGIPVVMVDGRLEKAPEAYRFLGTIFDLKSKAEMLATYAEEALDYAADLKATMDEVSLYYGDGALSLSTAPVGSPHAEIFELIGAKNVVNTSVGVENRVDITAEQIIAWNPDVVILNGEPKGDLTPAQAVAEFKLEYETLNAVNNDSVYAIPNYPYSWIDRPQSTNRLIGIYWLASILYPSSNINIKEEAQVFYELFYHWDLTETEISLLLGE